MAKEHRTFKEECSYIERLNGNSFLIKKGFVSNMKVEGIFYKNELLEKPMFDELKHWAGTQEISWTTKCSFWLWVCYCSTKCGYFWSKQSHHRRKITKEEEGWYTCKAKNAAGFSTKDIEISVKFPPRVSNESRNITIALNSTFTKECYLRGDPQITSVNWTKDGVLLSKNNTLVIRQVMFKDKGNYECTAKNDYCKANSSFWIHVTGELYIVVYVIYQTFNLTKHLF
ncbi:unnamed protein product [Pocillopora meandrina]|uniref:Ig-like domain-containing protein n=1 Tax=Pocillopora meandrina TaxID=46732 RepID=A0AAU9XPK9_9CNID|nr:unnamed protein product [Pocillopora meandrina]